MRLFIIPVLLFCYTPFCTAQNSRTASPHAIVVAKDPLLVKNSIFSREPISYSGIFSYNTAVRGSALLFKLDSISQLRNMVSIVNLPLIKIISIAYETENEEVSDHLNRVIADMPMPEKLLPPLSQMSAAAIEQWKISSGYCFELKIDHPKDDYTLYKAMQEEIRKYFRITGHIEKRKVPYWALSAIKGKEHFKTAATNGALESEVTSTSIVLKNASFKTLQFVLQQKNSGIGQPIIIDESGYSGLINITINAPLTNLEAVRTELNKLGIDLVPKETVLDMLVLKNI